ncbi:MAG: Crp/Fnr family transcriptional regulator [Filimonas sp.]|nr:Crp/Fnr family transcriptional regulator [Filimonas sp.]
MNNLPKTLLLLFTKAGTVSPELEDAIGSILHHRCLKKRELLLEAGRICQNIYFIESGLTRSFYLDESIETSSWFMKENDIIISVKSFFLQQPAEESIQAIEDTSLYYVSYTDLLSLYDQFSDFNHIGRRLTEYYYMQAEERLINVRKRDAFERYRFIAVNHPEFIQRVPGKYIASYLGITEETLSRLRSRKLI